MTKKGMRSPKDNTPTSPRKVLISISIIIILVIAVASVLYFVFSRTSEVPFSLNAAIIDQLAKEFPNPTFVENATDILKNAGFNINYYNESLDVGFFKTLAKNNYGIIILRVHSALREDNSTVDLFTSEEFSQYKYEWELENGYVAKGEFLYRPGKYYFAITARFVENLDGRFPKSIVFAMGCWSLKPEADKPLLARAFIDKGAKAYLGWTDLVWPRDTDSETLRLLRLLLNENKTFGEALSQPPIYPYRSGNITIPSRMNFYPQSVSNLKITDLAKEVRTASALTAVNSLKGISTVSYVLNLSIISMPSNLPNHRGQQKILRRTLQKRKGNGFSFLFRLSM